jgi:3-dehydroquinate synthetase
MAKKWRDLKRKPTLKDRMDDAKADVVREDGRLERTCKHGIGHTVGHAKGLAYMEKYDWIHGCDGCCSKWDDEEGN